MFFKKKRITKCTVCVAANRKNDEIKDAKVQITYNNGKELLLCQEHFNEIMIIIKEEPKRLEQIKEIYMFKEL